MSITFGVLYQQERHATIRTHYFQNGLFYRFIFFFNFKLNLFHPLLAQRGITQPLSSNPAGMQGSDLVPFPGGCSPLRREYPAKCCLLVKKNLLKKFSKTHAELNLRWRRRSQILLQLRDAAGDTLLFRDADVNQ